MAVGQNAPSPILDLSLLQRAFSEIFGRGIHIAGCVVDENGNMLDDVTIGVTRREGAMEEEFKVNGTFDLNYSNDLCIYIGVYKDGYYQDGEVYMVDEGIPRDSFGHRCIVDTNKVFVLRKVGGDYVRNPGGRRSLFVKVSGERNCVFLLQSANGNRFEPRLEENSFPSVYDDDFDGATYTNALFLHPTLTLENNSLQTIGVTLRSDEIGHYLKNPTLEVIGTDCGFYKYEPRHLWRKTFGTLDDEVFAEMDVAPEYGYTNKLQLSSTETDYFYMRLGPYYGKAYLTKNYVRDCFLRDAFSTYRMSLRYILQADGSRNVRTRRE